jgi:hypothetical protein
MISGGGTYHQEDYGDRGISFFEHGTQAESHSIPRVLSGSTKVDPQSHPLKSTEGSPPPHSATTSGSTATPTSVGGLSSAGYGQNSELIQSSTSSQYPQPSHPQSSGEGWSVSVTDGMITQPYSDEGADALTHGGAEVGFSDEDHARYNQGGYPSAIKLLVSNNVAGSIIGRAGQTISELQTQSSARIKLSQTGDYYPGTQDRVCLVQGQVENVKVALQLLLERLFMLQEQQHSQHVEWQPKGENGAMAAAPAPQAPPAQEPPPNRFDFVVRMLVPSSSCGMIIGKSGANIKHMEESSGVSSVRLSPKEGSDPNNQTSAIPSGTSERVVTLTGPTLDSCLNCLYIVLDGMGANHEICRYTNMTTSYSRLLVPGAYATVPQPGRPVMLVPPPTGEWDAPASYGQFATKRSNSQPDLAHMPIDQQGLSRLPPESPRGALVQLTSRDAIQQYSPAFHDTQQSYSVDTSLMIPSPGRAPQPSNVAGQLYLVPSPSTGLMEYSSMRNSSSAPDLLALQFQENMRISNPPNSALVDYTNFAPQLPQATPPGFSAQVLVPDTMIGSILGRGGRTLNELQMHSNTRIRISQRGEYMPGTRNRIVTIRGPTAHSVSLAQYLMSQRMVLPPTASYSPQPAPYHPLQLQPQPQRLSAHQSPQPTHAHTPATSLSNHHHQVLHRSNFQRPDHLHTPASNAPTSSSLTPSRSSSSKELPHS